MFLQNRYCWIVSFQGDELQDLLFGFGRDGFDSTCEEKAIDLVDVVNVDSVDRRRKRVIELIVSEIGDDDLIATDGVDIKA